MSDIHVTAGQSLQAAIDSATSGDSVLLERGATFQGNFFPGLATGVKVRTEGAFPVLTRVTPAEGELATLASGNNDPVLRGDPGKSDWEFSDLRIVPGVQDGIQNNGASRMTYRRILMVGGANGLKRGIQGNGVDVKLLLSHIANCWSSSQDAQAFCAWDGPGPYTVNDNFLEASGENIMFGGANSAKPENIPADVLVTGNHCFKRLEWKGTNKVIKNLFELKSVKRARITENLFENNWGNQGQPGYSIVFTPRNDEGQSPWSCVKDVLFEGNTIIGQMGANILGRDSFQPSDILDQVVIRKNLFITEGRTFQIGGEVGKLTLDHLTCINNSDQLCQLYKGEVREPGSPTDRPALYAVQDLTISNIVGSHRQYGVKADGGGMGKAALDEMCVTYAWLNNAVAETGGVVYPPQTLHPDQATHDAQFVGKAYLLKPDSIYRNIDGTDLGWTGSEVTPEEPKPEVTTITLTIVHQGKTITVTLPGTVKVEP